MKNTRTLQQLTAGILAVLFIATSSQAGLIFSIDRFTPNELTISIPPGSALAGFTTSTDHVLFLVDSNATNNNWILPNASFSNSASGALGGISAVGAALADNQGPVGDYASISFAGSLVTGATASPTITASITGSNIFDPTQVSSFVLTWGFGNWSSYPLGEVQSITAVPEPTSFILLSAPSGVLFFFRRNLS